MKVLKWINENRFDAFWAAFLAGIPCVWLWLLAVATVEIGIDAYMQVVCGCPV